MKGERVHHLDWLKVLIVYGIVVYHVALVFVYAPWLVSNAQRSVALSVFAAFCFPWGIPAMFLIAGADAWFGLRSHTVSEFVRKRFLRLMVPFAAGLVVLSPLQRFIASRQPPPPIEQLPAYYVTFFRTIQFDGGLQFIGRYWLHLWFLGYLFVISAVCAPLLAKLRSAEGTRFSTRVVEVAARRGVFVFALPLVLAELILRPLFPSYQDWADVATYVLVFVWGAVVFSDRRLEDAIRAQIRGILAVAVAASFALAATTYLAPQGVHWAPYAGAIAWSLYVWAWLHTVLYIGVRWFDRPSRFVTYAEESVLPVYVIHHPIVLLVAGFVVTLSLGVWAKFFLVLSAVALLTFLVYELGIRRWPVMRALFGLGPQRKAGPGSRGKPTLGWIAASLVLLVAGCGSATSVASRTPSPSASTSPAGTPSSSPSAAPSPTPTPALAAGAPAWVDVSVASGWRSPSSPRSVDAPALANPADIRGWVSHMTAADKIGLIDRLDTQALLGDEVFVIQVDGAWAKVAVVDQATPLDPRGYPVWIPVRQLTAVPPIDADASVTVVSPTTVLRGPTGAIEVSFGTTLPLVGTDSGKDVVALPDGATMTVDPAAVTTAGLPATGAAVVASASKFLGLPYLWGGTSAFGFDCSGLVHLVYKQHGAALPRDSDPQSKTGIAISRSDLQAGDLVFFSSAGSAYHVGIYAGGGMVIDSPSPGYAVEKVALTSMPNIADYSGARRYFGAGPVPSPTPAGLPRSLSGAEWTKLPTSDQVVALTFDAGGNDAGVAPILRALAAARVPATFFLTGRWTEVYPSDAKTIAASYGIGNHTYSHPYLTSLSDAQVRDEVTHAENVIRSTTGRDPHPLFRFPYGSTDARVLADVHALGYGGIRWTVDTLGWEGASRGQSTASVLQRVLASLAPGEIVLMHVGAATDGTTLDASALPSVISAVQQKGYRFVLVSSYVT